jgi:4-carboxymuconolactone decarboxylase
MDLMASVSPALARYTEHTLLDEVWKRPALSPRDRGVVTVAALVARNQTAELSSYVARALDNGVTPAELSEMVTHLAFYAGWGNASAAVAIIAGIFGERGIGVDRLPPSGPILLPIDEAAENKRAEAVQKNVGDVAPGVVHYTGALIFNELWLRPDLAPRDRSLVTVTALIANGQVAQIPFHLNRAMDNGLTRTEAGELLTHLAFYVGWPNVFSAIPVVKDVLEQRAT